MAKVYRGHEKRARTGFIIGHEFTGVILSAGSGVKNFKPGDHVVSPFTTFILFELRGTNNVAHAGSVSIVPED